MNLNQAVAGSNPDRIGHAQQRSHGRGSRNPFEGSDAAAMLNLRPIAPGPEGASLVLARHADVLIRRLGKGLEPWLSAGNIHASQAIIGTRPRYAIMSRNQALYGVGW